MNKFLIRHGSKSLCDAARVTVMMVTLSALLTESSLAQTGGGYDLTWNSIDSGGEMYSTGGAFKLGGTIGQIDAGPLTGGVYTLNGGFWTGRQLVCAPGPAPTPHDILKNRYFSFAPDKCVATVAIEILLPDGRIGWVGAPILMDWSGIDATDVALVVANPVFRVWNESVVQVAGCAVAPDRTYELRATPNAVDFSAPLVVQTVPAPSAGSWADVVGSFDSVTQAWTAPNGFVNFNDIDAAVKKFQVNLTAPHVVVIDLHPQWPNYVVNFSDIDMIIKGFQNTAYPVPASDCQTIANCPLGGEAACLP